MHDQSSDGVSRLLARPEIHEKWTREYRNPENERFYEEAFEQVLRALNPRPGALVLDAGCGTCAHSVRLARRGLRVVAVDFSESALEMARTSLRDQRLEGSVELRREDLRNLSFPGSTFDHVFCWGVLMHIPFPAVEAAIGEIGRVLRPGGSAVVSEANVRSVQSWLLRWLRTVRGRRASHVNAGPWGIEHWSTSSDGAALVTRETDMRWLTGAFERHGLRLRDRRAGQFTEAYTRLASPRLRRLVHGLNAFWFRRVGAPYEAFGNILIFEKS